MTETELITISYSEIDAFRQCPFKHQLSYVERWQRTPDALSALGKGGAWHANVMEPHYESLKSSREDKLPEAKALYTAQYAVECGINQLENEDLKDLMWWMYKGFTDVYGADWDWHIKTVENTIIIPLFWADGTPSVFQLKVKIDLVVMDVRGRLWIVDHKSCGQMPGETDFDFDEQFKFYTSVLRRMGYPIAGCIHDAALTKMNKGDLIKPGDPGYKASMKAQPLANRFKRTLIAHTEAELAMVNDELLRTATLMYSDANTHERHPNSDTCKWRCSFTEACLFGRRSNSDVKTRHMLQDTGFTQEFARH